MARKPFSLTYVTYEEGDSVGLVCALLALAPVFIIVAYATLLFMGFWAAYAALFLILYVPRVGRPYWRELLGAAVVALAAAVAGSRVYLGYHSADQVCAGLGFGSVFAAGWIEAYGRLLRPRLGGWVRNSPVCRYLLVRDCAHVADVLRVDYDAAMRRLGSSSPRKKRS
ncbi:dolichyldiphosphatase [Aureococcus anophagefferens]|nr:dolichyldiphosphatase [Aureococcus anophagefferens]